MEFGISEGVARMVGEVLRNGELFPEVPVGYDDIPQADRSSTPPPPWEVVYRVEGIEGQTATVRFALKGAGGVSCPHMRGFGLVEVGLPVRPLKLKISLGVVGVEIDTYLMPEGGELDELRRQLVEAVESLVL